MRIITIIKSWAFMPSVSTKRPAPNPLAKARVSVGSLDGLYGRRKPGHQHWIIEAELTNALEDLLDLLPGMSSGVAVVRSKLINAD
jgi:hypothetical protein